MVYNNINLGGLFGWNATFSVPNLTLILQIPYIFKYLDISLYDFRCFGDKDSFSIPWTEDLVFLDLKKKYIKTDTTIYYTR